MQAPIKEHRIVDQSVIHNNLNLKWRKQTAKRNPKTQGTPRIKEYPKRDEVSFKSPKICRKKLIMVLIYAFVGEKLLNVHKLRNFGQSFFECIKSYKENFCKKAD